MPAAQNHLFPSVGIIRIRFRVGAVPRTLSACQTSSPYNKYAVVLYHGFCLLSSGNAVLLPAADKSLRSAPTGGIPSQEKTTEPTDSDPSDRRKAPFEIGDDIVDMLGADGETDRRL